jgi:hypothetical protein
MLPILSKKFNSAKKKARSQAAGVKLVARDKSKKLKKTAQGTYEQVKKTTSSTAKKVKDKNLYQRTKRKVGEKTGKYKKATANGKFMMTGNRLGYTEDAAIPNTWNYGNTQQDYRFGTGSNTKSKSRANKFKSTRKTKKRR